MKLQRGGGEGKGREETVNSQLWRGEHILLVEWWSRGTDSQLLGRWGRNYISKYSCYSDFI